VVDAEGCLLGGISHDDALDVLRQEQQKDLEKIMGIGGDHAARQYLATPPWVHFKNRIGWVAALAVLGFVSGSILHHYEAALDALVILALYTPMLADAGGNTGSQSATVVIRALSVGEIEGSWRELMVVLWKELQVSMLIAVVLGLLAWVKVMLLSGSAQLPDGVVLGWLGLAIAVALMCQVVTASLLGAFLPMLSARFHLDPAVVASPALTTLVDISGLLLYFSIVSAMVPF